MQASAIRWAAVAAWLFAAGCPAPADPDKPAATDGAQTEPPPTTDTAPATPDSADTGGGGDGCARAIVGPAGGTLGLDDVVVTVPADALALDVDLSLCPIAAPAGFSPLSTAAALGPEALTLALPVSVTVALSLDPAATQAGLFTPDPDGASVHQVLAALDGAGAITGPSYRAGALFAAEDASLSAPYVPVGGVADLLVIMDNSCSMEDDQVKLANEFDSTMQRLLDNGTDFHLGVVTTDIDDPSGAGELQDVGGLTWVDPAVADPLGLFAEMVQVGSLGSGAEKGFGAAYVALEPLGDTYNAGFRRDGVRLALLVVSDEDDATPASVINTYDFGVWLETLVTDPGDVSFHSLVNTAGASQGTRYMDMTTAMGGHVQDILAATWVPFLEQIADDLAGGMVLDPEADALTIEVWAVPADGGEPHALDPSDVTYDPVTHEVGVSPEAVPSGAELIVVYVPA